MRMNLKLLRVSKGKTQAEFADLAGVSRPTYISVENGVTSGKQDFWGKIQTAYNVPDEEMWRLMQNEK